MKVFIAEYSDITIVQSKKINDQKTMKSISWRLTKYIDVALLLMMFLIVSDLLADEDFRAVSLVSGLEHPWGMAFLPDGQMLITERSGQLKVLSVDQWQSNEIRGLPEISAKGQGGLLDVAIHPDFERNQWVYLSYAAKGEGGIGTEVGRGRLTGDRLEGWQTLFRLQPKSGARYHFGSRLVFDRDGNLYITLGDRGERMRSQRLDDHAGSVIRLTDDGSVPADNPFVAEAGAMPEIYSYGHRNIQGAALHPETGQLWIHEHGPQGGDELNLIKPGVNYGWPVITYGAEYGSGESIGEGTHKPGMEQPLHYWVPSIAPSGMTFYTGNRFPDWRGNLFIGSLKFQLLVRLELKGQTVKRETRMLKGDYGRIRDVENGPDGYLYLLTDAPNGQLIRLEPVN